MSNTENVIQWKGGTTAEHSAYTGPAREVTVDTDKNTLQVHDGVTVGGVELARAGEHYTKGENDTQLGLKADITYVDTEISEAKTSAKSISNVMLSGSLAIDQTTTTKGALVHLYTGDGSASNALVTGAGTVDANSKTQMESFNYPIYLSRTAGTSPIMYHSAFGSGVEDAALSEAEWEVGGEFALANNGFISSNLLKSRDEGTTSYIGHVWKVDGLRGASNVVYTNLSAAEELQANGVQSFNTNGITLGTRDQVNFLDDTYVLHQEIYTQFKYGKTNGVKWIYLYNPITGAFMRIREGSNDVIGSWTHDETAYQETKQLNGTANGRVYYGDENKALQLYAPNSDQQSFVVSAWNNTKPTKNTFTFNGNEFGVNQSGGVYVDYGFANSDYKEIKTQTAGGTDGTPIYDRDGNLLFIGSSGWGTVEYIWITEKNSDGEVISVTNKSLGTDDWYHFDYNRGFANWIELNNSDAEKSGSFFDYVRESSTDQFFNNPTDDTNLNVTNGKLVFPNGRLSNGGYNIETADFTGSLDFVGVGDGAKYVGIEQGTNNILTYDKVSVGLYDKESANDNRLVINVESGEQYNTIGGELVTNGTFDTDTTGWTANNATLSVVSGRLQVADNGGSSTAYQSISTEVGEEYILEVDAESGATQVANIRAWNDTFSTAIGDVVDITLSANSFKSYKIEFIAESTTTVLGLISNGTESTWFDNISVFKKRATLGTPLTNPVCFVNKYPYQVASETPQTVRYDLPSIPLNVMESTTFDGVVNLKGNRKVYEVGTIFNNNRYVIDWSQIDLPVDGDNFESCDVVVEIKYNDEWIETGWRGDNTNAYGIRGYSKAKGVIIQTANAGLTADETVSGASGVITTVESSAIARIIVTYI